MALAATLFGPTKVRLAKPAQVYSNHVHNDEQIETDLKERLQLFEQESQNLTKEDIREFSLLSIYLHELSHTICPTENKKIAKKIGNYSSEMEALEELKAETTSARIFYQTNAHSSNELKLTKFLQFLIAEHHLEQNHTTDESGYYMCSNILVGSLIAAGAIVKNNNLYSIINVTLAFQTLAQLSTDILNRYDDKKSTPTLMRAYIKQLVELNTPHFHS